MWGKYKDTIYIRNIKVTFGVKSSKSKIYLTKL